jgi:hypothetical protein
MASRSVQISLANQTTTTLTLVPSGTSLSGGIWSPNDSPPPTVAPGATVQFGSESNGLLTGTQGIATYSLAAGGNLVLNWDNPFVGSFNASSVAPSGFSCDTNPSNANNASVKFTLAPLPAA